MQLLCAYAWVLVCWCCSLCLCLQGIVKYIIEWQQEGLDVLGLPVSYNNHTSLVIVVQPFAATPNESCILHMDSVAGGEK